MMTFEEIIPAIKQGKSVKRRFMDGRISIVKGKDGISRFRIQKALAGSVPYHFSVQDMLADDWKVF